MILFSLVFTNFYSITGASKRKSEAISISIRIKCRKSIMLFHTLLSSIESFTNNNVEENEQHTTLSSKPEKCDKFEVTAVVEMKI